MKVYVCFFRQKYSQDCKQRKINQKTYTSNFVTRRDVYFSPRSRRMKERHSQTRQLLIYFPTKTNTQDGVHHTSLNYQGGNVLVFWTQYGPYKIVRNMSFRVVTDQAGLDNYPSSEWGTPWVLYTLCRNHNQWLNKTDRDDRYVELGNVMNRMVIYYPEPFNLECIQRNLDLTHMIKIRHQTKKGAFKKSKVIAQKCCKNKYHHFFYLSDSLGCMTPKLSFPRVRVPCELFITVLLDIIYRAFITKVNKNNKYPEIRHSFVNSF